MSTPADRWWKEAACLGMAPMFDVDTYGSIPYEKSKGPAGSALKLLERLERERRRYRMQLQVCASCPVRRTCVKDAVAHERKAMRKPVRKAPWMHTACITGGYTPTERLLWHINAAYTDDEPLGQLARYALKQLTPIRKKDTK